MKRLFYRLNRLASVENINQNAYEWIKIHDAGKGGFSDEKGREMKLGSHEYNSSRELLMVLFALDIINMCFDDYEQTTHFQKCYVARDILEKRVDEVINYLMPKLTTLRLLFGLQIRDRDNLTKRPHKGKLQFINSVLNSALGIKIVSEKHNKLGMHFMRPSNNFEYSVEVGKWTTT